MRIDHEQNTETKQDLDRLTNLTMKMREHERQVAIHGKERRAILRKLRNQKVPFRTLAKYTGTSEQAIYKDVRFGK